MTIELKVPSVGESITEVAIGEWMKSEGDHVDQDEPVVELESEKATFEAPAPSAGVLSKILKRAGETATVGEVIAQIEPARDGASQSGQDKPKSKTKGKATPQRDTEAKREPREPREKPAEQAAHKKDEPSEARTSTPARSSSPRVMPAAERALAERGLKPEDVPASGPGGRLLKEDVERYTGQQKVPETPEPPTATESEQAESGGGETRGERGEESVPMTPIRRRIAERLVRAQQTAALLTTFNEVDMSAVKSLRQQHQDAFHGKHGVKLGFMSFFVKAAVAALQEIPQVNAEIRQQQIVYHNYCDIGIAIGGGKGLVVPVLRNTETMSLAQIEKAIEDFARRARTGDLRPDELRGGTFTISNGGIYGSLLSTPIVNPPQSGVLGMHAIQDRPVVREGAIVIRPMMYIALTYDHRIIDGREAVTFLRRIKELVEDPTRLLLEV